jgi:hypothetical protein
MSVSDLQSQVQIVDVIPSKKQGKQSKSRPLKKAILNDPEEQTVNIGWSTTQNYYDNRQIVKVTTNNSTESYYFLFQFGEFKFQKLVEFLIQYINFEKDDKKELKKFLSEIKLQRQKLLKKKKIIKHILSAPKEELKQLDVNDLEKKVKKIVILGEISETPQKQKKSKNKNIVFEYGEDGNQLLFHHFLIVNQNISSEKVIICQGKITKNDDDHLFYNVYIPPTLLEEGRKILKQNLSDIEKFISENKQIKKKDTFSILNSLINQNFPKK